MQVKNAFQVNPKLFVHGLCSNFKVTETLAETWYLSQTFYNHVYGWLLRKWEQLQNTPQLIYMSLNKNSVYCVMPRSSKLPTHVSEAEMSCGVFWSLARKCFNLFTFCFCSSSSCLFEAAESFTLASIFFIKYSVSLQVRHNMNWSAVLQQNKALVM